MARTIFRLPRFSALQHVSVLPDVWRMCAFTVCLSFLLCQVYNPIRRAVRDGQKKTLLFYLFHDCDAFFNMCTTFVTFILSFFNATVFTRWWRLRELCGTVNGRTVRPARGAPPVRDARSRGTRAREGGAREGGALDCGCIVAALVSGLVGIGQASPCV